MLVELVADRVDLEVQRNLREMMQALLGYQRNHVFRNMLMVTCRIIC